MPLNAKPALVLLAHGTASSAGFATTMRLAAEVARARPGSEVRPAFLDVARPLLADVLADVLADNPGGQSACSAVVVPVLLSTGFHVQSDIPAIVQAHGSVVVSEHLGPHPLVLRAVSERLFEAGGEGGRPTLLVAAGSSRPEAGVELQAAGRVLAGMLGAPVTVATLADDVPSLLAAREAPVQVATYLLAEGSFADQLNASLAGLDVIVATPIGVHPAIVELVWRRFDDARGD